MARLIDADAPIKRYDLHIVIGAGDNICIDIADIAKAPTVDAVPVVHGRWKEADDGDGAVCSVCGEDFCNVYLEVERFNYCPTAERIWIWRWSDA